MVIERVELKLNDGIIDTPHLTDDVEILQRYLKDWGVLPKDAPSRSTKKPICSTGTGNNWSCRSQNLGRVNAGKARRNNNG